MERPPLSVRKAIERIQFEICDKADETLVAAWIEWSVQQEQMSDSGKWQSPAKRLRSSADASLQYIAK